LHVHVKWYSACSIVLLCKCYITYKVVLYTQVLLRVIGSLVSRRHYPLHIFFTLHALTGGLARSIFLPNSNRDGTLVLFALSTSWSFLPNRDGILVLLALSMDRSFLPNRGGILVRSALNLFGWLIHIVAGS